MISEKYGDERRSKIGYDEFDISMEDLIPRDNTVIAMTSLGYIKRMTIDIRIGPEQRRQGNQGNADHRG